MPSLQHLEHPGRRVALVALLAGCASPPSGEPAPAYVGAAACGGCHAAESAAWTGSPHDRAHQDPAIAAETFDGRTVTGAGDAATLLRDGDRLVVRTADAHGVERELPVWRVIGDAPVRQLLVERERGEVNALPWLWDTRPAPEGQRWRHLYDGDTVPPGDPLHWDGPAHRWNAECGECHATGFRSGFDPAAATWTTTAAEADVGCEACHGPGSAHVAWARAPSGEDPGLPVGLAGDGARWLRPPTDRIAHREPARTDHVEVDTCAACHALRLRLTDAAPAGAPFLDGFVPSLLEEGAYQADGQLLGEDYVWGSFVQSRMYAAGVTCTDCHDPHRAALRADDVCARCHDPVAFGADHTHHQGVTCRDCHMPARTYMQVDVRHDHSFRVPRPDLSVSIGVSEPCTPCHTDRDAAWAAATVRAWFPAGRAGTGHYGEALHAGRTRAPDAPARLSALIADPGAPGIARATAVRLRVRYPTPDLPAVLAGAASDPDALVRREVAAVGGVTVALPLAADPVRAVRIAAGSTLAGHGADAAVAEARAFYRLHADRADANVGLGDLEAALGDPAAAEAAYRAALALDPRSVVARVNLADLYRGLGRDPDGVVVLRAGLDLDPDAAGLWHALGFAQARLGQPDAIASLRRAAALEPAEPRYAYVLAVAVASGGDVDEARRIAADAYARAPGDVGLLDLLEGWAAETGEVAAFTTWRERRARDAPWSTP